MRSAGEQVPGRSRRGCRRRETRSGEDGFDEAAVDVGEPELAALVGVGEPFVIEAEAVEEGGLEIVDVDGILDDVEAEFVGGAIG